MNVFNQFLVTLLPLVPKPVVQWVSRSYVAGETMEEMIESVRNLNGQGCQCTVDLLGEFTHEMEQARTMALFYEAILQRLYEEKLDANISIKLTALGLLIDETSCYTLLKRVVEQAKKYHCFVRIDMEDSQCTSATIRLYLKLREEGHDNVGCVVQAYLRRTLGDIREMMDAGAKNFRLCKGIYVEPREVAYKHPAIINQNYALLLDEMVRHRAFVGIATHDETLVWEAQRLIDRYQLTASQYEFQMLLGVDESLRSILVNSGHPMRVYVPFGKDWYGYCLRRLKENPKIAGYVFSHLFQKYWQVKAG